MTHDDLVAALRAVEGLVDVGVDPPNFHYRGRRFLHFHRTKDGVYADVKFGRGDFEPVWVTTPRERRELLARVVDHVELLEQRAKRTRQGRVHNVHRPRAT